MSSKQEIEALNALIESASERVYQSAWVIPKQYNIIGQAMALVASANSSVPVERNISRYDAERVLERALDRTALSVTNLDFRELKVLREFSDFVEAATTGRNLKVSLDYSDFLPYGHSQSTKNVSQLSAEELRERKIQWEVSNPQIQDEYRPMIASAYRAPAGTVERDYLVARLQASPVGAVPAQTLLDLINE